MALFSLLCSLLRWIGETSLIHSIILQYIRCATPFNFIYNSIFFLQFWGVVQKEKIVVVEVRTAHRAAERIVADNKETGWTRTAETVNRHLFLFILYILTLFVCVSLWHWLLDVEQQQPEEKNRVLPFRLYVSAERRVFVDIVVCWLQIYWQQNTQHHRIIYCQ